MATADTPQPTLRIIDTRALRGPNIWSRSPAIVMLVDLGVLEDFPSNTIPGFNEALLELIPTLEDHACSLGRRGGFVTRLHDGTWLGHVTEHVALELQSLAGTESHAGKTRSVRRRARPLQRRLRVPRRGRGPRGRPAGRRAGQPPRLC